MQRWHGVGSVPKGPLPFPEGLWWATWVSDFFNTLHHLHCRHLRDHAESSQAFLTLASTCHPGSTELPTQVCQVRGVPGAQGCRLLPTDLHRDGCSARVGGSDAQEPIQSPLTGLLCPLTCHILLPLLLV